MKGYDYSTPAAYLVTICIAGRECLLGDVVDGVMVMSTFGQAVQACWHERQAVWQRGYYERVVRNENELHAIRTYIENNPAQWALDCDNPISAGEQL